MLQRALFAIAALAFLSLGPAIAAGPPAGAPQLPPQPKVRPAGIPAGALMLSPCVNGMGEHWAALKDMPIGPIYGVYKGKLVFTEVMLDQKFFAEGKSLHDVLKPLPGHAINHVDIEFHPKGHEGFPIPHYDVHAYFVSHAAHMQYCPDGAPDPDKASM